MWYCTSILKWQRPKYLPHVIFWGQAVKLHRHSVFLPNYSSSSFATSSLPMAAPRTVWKKGLKFGTMNGDSTMIFLTKSHVCTSSVKFGGMYMHVSFQLYARLTTFGFLTSSGVQRTNRHWHFCQFGFSEKVLKYSRATKFGTNDVQTKPHKSYQIHFRVLKANGNWQWSHQTGSELIY